jgi:hypothetical protein
LLQDLGFLAFTLPQVDILMPTKKPRGRNSPGTTTGQQCTTVGCGSVCQHSVGAAADIKDRIRLWKDGVRDLVMELCCALHNWSTDPVAAAYRFNR